MNQVDYNNRALILITYMYMIYVKIPSDKYYVSKSHLFAIKRLIQI